jgi:hypothetical protein
MWATQSIQPEKWPGLNTVHFRFYIALPQCLVPVRTDYLVKILGTRKLTEGRNFLSLHWCLSDFGLESVAEYFNNNFEFLKHNLNWTSLTLFATMQPWMAIMCFLNSSCTKRPSWFYPKVFPIIFGVGIYWAPYDSFHLKVGIQFHKRYHHILRGLGCWGASTYLKKIKVLFKCRCYKTFFRS